MAESEPCSKTGLAHCCKLVYDGRAGSPFCIDYKSYTTMPGVAAPQDFFKVLLECEFRV